MAIQDVVGVWFAYLYVQILILDALYMSFIYMAVTREREVDELHSFSLFGCDDVHHQCSS